MDDKVKECGVVLTRLFHDFFDDKMLSNVNELWEHHIAISAQIDYVKARQKKFIRQPRDESKWDRFHKWCDEREIVRNGVCKGNVGLSNDQVGLVAERDLTKGTVVAILPTSELLCVRCGRVDKAEPSLKSILEDKMLKVMDNIGLAMVVAHELLLGERSQWKPYLDILPQSFDTPLYYTTDQLKKLKGSTVFEHALRHYRSVVRFYVYFYLRLFGLENDVDKTEQPKDDSGEPFNPGPINPKNFTFELFCWCVSVTASRMNNLPNILPMIGNYKPDTEQRYYEYKAAMAPFMFPFLDLTNYDAEQTQPARMEYIVGESQIRLTIHRNYKKGEEVRMYYGDRADWNFLIFHGFLPEYENAGNVVELKIGLPGDLQNDLVKGKMEYLRRRNIKPEYLSGKSGRYIFSFHLRKVGAESLYEAFNDSIRNDMLVETSEPSTTDSTGSLNPPGTPSTYDSEDYFTEPEVATLVEPAPETPFIPDASDILSNESHLTDAQVRSIINDALTLDSTAGIISNKANTGSYFDAAKALIRFAVAFCAVTPNELEAPLYCVDGKPSNLLTRAIEFLLDRLLLHIKYLQPVKVAEAKNIGIKEFVPAKERRTLDAEEEKKKREEVEKVLRKLFEVDQQKAANTKKNRKEKNTLMRKSLIESAEEKFQSDKSKQGTNKKKGPKKSTEASTEQKTPSGDLMEENKKEKEGRKDLVEETTKKKPSSDSSKKEDEKEIKELIEVPNDNELSVANIVREEKGGFESVKRKTEEENIPIDDSTEEKTDKLKEMTEEKPSTEDPKEGEKKESKETPHEEKSPSNENETTSASSKNEEKEPEKSAETTTEQEAEESDNSDEAVLKKSSKETKEAEQSLDLAKKKKKKKNKNKNKSAEANDKKQVFQSSEDSPMQMSIKDETFTTKDSSQKSEEEKSSSKREPVPGSSKFVTVPIEVSIERAKEREKEIYQIYYNILSHLLSKT